MKKTPCEIIIWNVLPVIRKMIACCLIHEHGLSQRETADKMGVTPAAICQYECDKRGKEKDCYTFIRDEIKSSADKIMIHGHEIVGSEICRICKLIKENDLEFVENTS